MRYFTYPWGSCDKEFARKADLSRHYRIHLDDRPYACPEEGCTKQFHQRSSLKIHQRTHTGEKPYICEISTCQRAFSDPSSYARHQRSHKNERPYVCCVTSCHQSFSRKHGLHRHQLQHHEQDSARVWEPYPEIAFQAPLPNDSVPILPFVPSSQPALRGPGSDNPALDWCVLDFSVLDDIVQQTIIQYNGPHPSYSAEGHTKYPEVPPQCFEPSIPKSQCIFPVLFDCTTRVEPLSSVDMRYTGHANSGYNGQGKEQGSSTNSTTTIRPNLDL
ncbi:hypothetical protein BDV18DRAFT_12854 [Aspergillus unguis]